MDFEDLKQEGINLDIAKNHIAIAGPHKAKCKVIAERMKTLMDELTKEGFRRSEAIEIITSMIIGGMII